MADAGLIEAGGPCVELSAVAHLEGDVIKAGPQQIKGIATAARVLSQPARKPLCGWSNKIRGIPASPGATWNSLTKPKPATRWCQSALTLMSLTVSAMCAARSKVGIGRLREDGMPLIFPCSAHCGMADPQTRTGVQIGGSRASRSLCGNDAA
jgi:hypothetical protein